MGERADRDSPDSFNEIILGLYEDVFRLAVDRFKEDSLARLRDVIPFDSAIWGSGAEDPQLIFGIAACDFPFERLVAYSVHWQRHDVLRSAVSRRPGECLRNEDLGPVEDHYASEIYREFCGPSGIEHAMGVTLIDSVTNVGELVFLFRADRSAPFSDLERDRLGQTMPHLVAAWRHRLLWHVAGHARTADLSPGGLPGGHAVVDGAGQVHASDAAFGLRMRALFPDWLGPRLPPELSAAIAGVATSVRVGGQTFRLHRGGDRHILSLAAETALPLSPAEARVAERFASGMTAPRVALDLGISRATVRNHLTAIYEKLGVHSKVELVRRLGELSPN
jgi:DNA-binding CsgD family transcriptional regulator